MSQFNRDDIMIAVTKTGHVFVAQGKEADNPLLAREDIADVEYDLYHSQLKHRGVYKEEGSYRIGTVTKAKKAGTWLYIGSPKNITGCPLYIGQLED